MPPFDWENQATWLQALQNVESVYVTYFPDLPFPGAADAVRTFAKLAVESGVQLVLLSGRGDDGGRGRGPDRGQACGTILRGSRSPAPDIRGGGWGNRRSNRPGNPLRAGLSRPVRVGIMDRRLPPEFATPLVKLFTTVLDGRNARLVEGVQRALGRAPRDFADYARDVAASSVWTSSRTQLRTAGSVAG